MHTIPAIYTKHTMHSKHTIHTIPTIHAKHTIHINHTVHEIITYHYIPCHIDGHTYTTPPPHHTPRNTHTPPHHREGGGQYHTPTTPRGGRGTVLWLTHDHGRGGWNAGPFLYIYMYVYLQLNELFIYNQLTYLGFLKMMFNFSQRDIHITGEYFCTKISSRTSENCPGFDRSGGSSWSLLDGWNDDFWVYLKMWIWGHHGIFSGI